LYGTSGDVKDNLVFSHPLAAIQKSDTDYTDITKRPSELGFNMYVKGKDTVEKEAKIAKKKYSMRHVKVIQKKIENVELNVLADLLGGSKQGEKLEKTKMNFKKDDELGEDVLDENFDLGWMDKGEVVVIRSSQQSKSHIDNIWGKDAKISSSTKKQSEEEELLDMLDS
jgi:hypothetical protein